MKTRLLICVALSTLLVGVVNGGCDSDEGRTRRTVRRIKKHKKHKKYNKRRRHRRHKHRKGPRIDVTEAKRSAKGIAKLAYRACAKGDFALLQRVVLKPSEAKAFAKPELFKKYVNEAKLKEKFAAWQATLGKARYRRIKAKDDQKLKIKPGTKPAKYEELAAAITREVTVWQVKGVGRGPEGGEVKCALVAIKLADHDWRLARLKSCKK